MVGHAEDCRLGFIYWIASYPKSGNSWARAFLTSLITDGVRGKSGKLPEIIPDENHGRFYKPFLRKPIDDASNAELALVRPRVHRDLAKKTQNFLLLKTHSLMGIHNGTATVTFDVTAGAIYLVRNPLDVAVSYGKVKQRGADRAIAAMNRPGRVPGRLLNRAYEVSGSWSENVESWTKPHDRILVLRHEDMLADPRAEFWRIVQLLKMDVSEDQFTRALEDSRSFSGSTGKWREALTEQQVAAVVTANEPLMKRFGYWLDEFDALVSRPAKTSATSP
jgi:hypothetical protein